MSVDGKRILAFFLCGLILVWWTLTQQPRKKPPITAPSTQSAVVALPSKPDKASAKTIERQSKAAKLEPATAPTLIKLSNPELEIALSNRGGSLADVALPKYRRSQQKNSAPVELGSASAGINGWGGGPLWSFNLGGESAVFDDRALAKSTVNGRELLLEFPLSENGLQLRKHYTLGDRDYLVHSEVSLTNHGQTPQLINANAIMGAELGSSFVGRYNASEPLQLAAYVNDKRLKQISDKLGQNAERTPGNSISWVAITDRYFMSAMLPTQDSKAEAVAFKALAGDSLLITDSSGKVLAQTTLKRYDKPSKSGMINVHLNDELPAPASGNLLMVRDTKSGAEKLWLSREEVALNGHTLSLTPAMWQRWQESGINVGQAAVELSYPARTLKPGESTSYQLDIYLGPKDLPLITALNRQLEYSIDYGSWIGAIARPMLGFLNSLHRWFGNWGLAIILLTLVVRLLLAPLTFMQIKSMKKMQALKPNIDLLREKYKDNKEALNREMMNLFRTERVNPMGGCFPLLLQMPVFFALYRVLYNAIELRHAPFVGWITDLSNKDPLFITPVLMGATMWWQQKLTPTTGMDPSQETMMKIMPLMFSVMMLYLPSGLVLYIFVSTLLGIMQQLYMQRSNQQTSPGAKQAASA